MQSPLLATADTQAGAVEGGGLFDAIEEEEERSALTKLLPGAGCQLPPTSCKKKGSITQQQLQGKHPSENTDTLR